MGWKRRTSARLTRARDIGGVELDASGLAVLGDRLRSPISPRHLAVIAGRGLYQRALHVRGDLEVDGDLRFSDARVQILVVDGDLVVRGRLEDRDDEENESLLLVGGDLRARDLFSFGTLEVHGDVVVSGHALFLDNACAAFVGGDLRARLVVDQYHHVAVVGGVEADAVIQDSRGRIVAGRPYDSFEFDDEVAGVLVRDVLEGEPDPDARHGFYVDNVDVGAIQERIRAGRDVLLRRA